jgi:hypothetical protein
MHVSLIAVELSWHLGICNFDQTIINELLGFPLLAMLTRSGIGVRTERIERPITT